MNENNFSKHYIMLDSENNIIDGWSDGPLPNKPIDGAILYNEQGGYQFRIILDGVPMEENVLFDEWGNPLYSYDTATGEVSANPPYVPDPVPVVREQLLRQNSDMCREILVNEFKSAAKGDGLQPYYFPEHNQNDLDGLSLIITDMLLQDPTGASMPPLEWQNANQLVCVPWNYMEIKALYYEFAAWKKQVRHRQDVIKEALVTAQTVDELNAVSIDYSDLLNFGGDGSV